MRETRFTPVRGNIQTRVRKLLEMEAADALIVAKAAFDRLLAAEREEFAEGRAFLRKALASLDWMVLPLSLNPTPAAAQGALAIEVRRDRADLLKRLEGINHAPSFEAVQRERAILAGHGGGCHQAIGVDVQLRPYGTLLSLRGKTDAGLVLDQRSLPSPRRTLGSRGSRAWMRPVTFSWPSASPWSSSWRRGSGRACLLGGQGGCLAGAAQV